MEEMHLMAQKEVSFKEFLETVPPENKAFVEELNTYLMDEGCKATFEEKKSGMLASYKYGKPPKAVLNILFRKKGMLVRIYGENANDYLDFLQTLPADMIETIAKSGICKRIVENTCSPKCTGYDVTIGGERYQKCRYGAFEFLITDESGSFVRAFAEHELSARIAV